MALILIAAALLTYLVPSGSFDRGPDKRVIPGSFHEVGKQISLSAAATPHKSTASLAYPASLPSVALAIPAGLAASSGLIVMIFFAGGMFGILRATGALDAGVERLVSVARGNTLVLIPILMVILSAGSSFLGLISEYLVIIPMMVVLAERLKLPPLGGVAIVTVASKIGYIASITNPVALIVAQPIAGVPPFSGTGLRTLVYLLFLPIGIGFVLRHFGRPSSLAEADLSPHRLSRRHSAVLVVLAAAIVGLAWGGAGLGWGNSELSAFYILVAGVMAVAGGLSSRQAAESFVDGMKSMMLAVILVGVASGVEILLRDSLVLDRMIHDLTSLADGQPSMLVAQSLTVIEMLLDVLIPSTSGKAAVSLPILAPIAQLSGVSGQLTVMAFLFGNGLTNMVTPTSGMLLAFLAAGKVGYGEWLRFILPLFALLTVLALAIMAASQWLGY